MRKALQIKAYRRMLLIRFFEEQVEKLFTSGLVRGTAHTCVGQEAAAVGVCFALKKGDRVTSTHRGHGHFLAQGANPGKMMAELFGKESGYSRGRGGSQLMADYRLGFMGSNGITGAGLPLATGVALAMKMRHIENVALCFFGDGAVNQGAFHESLNMAAIWNLPVLFVCENNLYAMSTPVEKNLVDDNIAAKAAAYGIRGDQVDGNDIKKVYAAISKARMRAIAKGGPTLIECKTYRFLGHSRGDPRKYRTREEEVRWKKQDPVRLFALDLIKNKIITKEDKKHYLKEAKQKIREAIQFAKQSSFPDPNSLLEGVFA